MARAKIIYILMIKINKLFSFFSAPCFLKEIENMYSIAWSYGNTLESLGELEESCGNTHLWFKFPQHFSLSQTSTYVSITQQKHSGCFLFLNCCIFTSNFSAMIGQIYTKDDQTHFDILKFRPKTKDLTIRLYGIITEFVRFIPQNLMLISIALGKILIY